MGSAPSNAAGAAESSGTAAASLDAAAYGHGRKAVKRGQSMNERVSLLAEAVSDTADRIEHAIFRKRDKEPEKKKGRGGKKEEKEVKHKGRQSEKEHWDLSAGSESWRIRVRGAMHKAHKLIGSLQLLHAMENDESYLGAYQLIHSLPANMAEIVREDSRTFRAEWVELMEAILEVAKEMRNEVAQEAEKEAELEAAATELRIKYNSEYDRLKKAHELGLEGRELEKALEEAKETAAVASKTLEKRLTLARAGDASSSVGIEDELLSATPKHLKPGRLPILGEARDAAEEVPRPASPPPGGEGKGGRKKSVDGKGKGAAPAKARPRKRKGHRKLAIRSRRASQRLLSSIKEIKDLPPTVEELDAASDHIENLHFKVETFNAREKIDAETLTAAERRAVDALGMIVAHLHKCNNAWVLGKEWRLPPPLHTHTKQGVPLTTAGGYRNAALDAIRDGKVAVHLDAVSQVAPGFHEGDLGAPTLYLADPWDVELGGEDGGGGSVTGEHVKGLCMGGRHLLMLGQAVLEVGGPDALAKVSVVLHVGTWFEEQVVANLVSHGYYGLERTQFVILSQPRFNGYRWDEEGSQFKEDKSMDAVSIGTGFSFKQLTFSGDAKVITEEGVLENLEVSAADFLINLGVKWLQCSAVDDPFRLTRAGALDVDMLAMLIRRNTELSNNMIVETCEGSPSDQVRTGVVLQEQKPDMSEIDKASSYIIKGAALQTPASTEMLRTLMNNAEATHLPVSTGRYVMYLPIVKKALKESVLKPTLDLRARHVFPTLDIADASVLRGVNVVAVAGGGATSDDVTGRGSRPITDGRDLFYLRQKIISQMDKDKSFQAIVSTALSRVPGDSPVQMLVGDMARFRAVACCTRDTSSMKAFALAERLLVAGVDRLNVMTVAREQADIPKAHKILQLFRARDMLLECVRDVMSLDEQGSNKLIGTIEAYADTVDANLLVVGSEHLDDTNAMGSLALNLVKSLNYNTLLVKKSVPLLPPAPAGQLPDPVKFLLFVNHHDLQTLEFALDFMTPRQDHIVLLHVAEERSKEDLAHVANTERLLQRLEATAMRRGIRPTKRVVYSDDPANAVTAVSNEEKVQIVIVKDIFRPKAANPVTLDIIHAVHAAILLHRP